MSLPSAIRTRRQALGLTQLQAAQRAGWKSLASWQVYETGRQQPTWPTLQTLAMALEWSVFDLVKAALQEPETRRGRSHWEEAEP